MEQPLANDTDSQDNSTGANAADEAATLDEVSSLWPIFHQKDAINSYQSLSICNAACYLQQQRLPKDSLGQPCRFHAQSVRLSLYPTSVLTICEDYFIRIVPCRRQTRSQSLKALSPHEDIMIQQHKQRSDNDTREGFSCMTADHCSL